MKHLIIRADATSHIGVGHVMRCLALAQAWQDRGGKATFISHCDSELLKQRMRNEGFSLIPIDRICPDPADLKTTVSILKKHTTNQKTWLVLDGYHFTPEYQKAIRDAGLHLLVIDDMNHLPHYHADIVLNQNIHAPELKYHCDENTTMLLGTRYVLLRREFLKYRDLERQIPDKAKNILVTLGGADRDNVTLKVIRALNLIGDPKIEVKIVVGPANRNIEKIQKELTLLPFTFHISLSVSDVPELMAWADVAITAGGSTCWELAFMGLPNVIITLAENQRSVGEQMDRIGVSQNLGWFEQVNSSDIVYALLRLLMSKDRRLAMSKQGQTIVDGEGVKRLTTQMHHSFVTNADGCGGDRIAC